MIPFALILLSTVLGLASAPFWWAMSVGLLERRTFSYSGALGRQPHLLALFAGRSLLFAQAASVGAFAAGRALSILIG